jgi:hypothetical protein
VPFEWGENPWGEIEWGGTGIAWAETDDDGNVLPIPPGDHDARETALARLFKQFADTETWPALFAGVFGTCFDDVEDVMGQVLTQRVVSTAGGQNLDAIGESVGRARGGQTSDADYRAAIKAEAASLVVSGTVNEILELVVSLEPAAIVTLRELYPAAFVLTITDLTAARMQLLAEILDDVPAAGVGAFLRSFDPDEVAGWDSVNGGVTTPGRWASVHGGTSPPYLWSTVRAIG